MAKMTRTDTRIGVSTDALAGDSSFKHAFYEEHYEVFLGLLDRRIAKGLERAAETAATLTRGYETRRKTGELHDAIHKEPAVRRGFNQIVAKVAVEPEAYWWIFQELGTLGRRTGKLSARHQSHLKNRLQREADGSMIKGAAGVKIGRGGGSYTATWKNKRGNLKSRSVTTTHGTYARSTARRDKLGNVLKTKKGVSRTTKHGIKPLHFMRDGFKGVFPDLVMRFVVEEIDA